MESEEGTNAVVMVGPDSEIAAYRTIVEQLDIRRAQVVVEAIIAEVSDTRAQELGVQWLFLGDSFGGGAVNFTNGGTSIAGLAGPLPVATRLAWASCWPMCQGRPQASASSTAAG